VDSCFEEVPALVGRLGLQHAKDGYSRRRNFGGSFVQCVLMYSPDGNNDSGSKSGQFEKIRR